jgi:hypothetical protein
MTAGHGGIELLLALDGETFAVDPAGRYWVKFVVRRIPPDATRPHGISYSLSLHDAGGHRLIGFDNAHAVRSGSGPGGRGRVEHDHRHRLQRVQPYVYLDAETLLADFWSDVDALLRERGVFE